MRALALSAALLASVGGTLLWRTSVAHGWESRDARAAWRADYERAYRRVARVPQPDVVDVRLVLDLDPPARRARVRATLALENRSAAPIDTLWVVVRRDVDSAAVFVDGARLARRDARFGVHVFAMARPLAPGARASLRYAGTLDRAGVRATAHDYDVTANGTFLSSGDLLPSLGYRHGYEIGDPAERRARGLAPSPTEMPPLPATDSARARVRGDAWLTLDATVSTSADQTVIASGRLVRAWRADGRRWFRYVADRPITPLFAVTSARLAVRRVRHRGVDVEVWHHPSHDANVGRMLDAATRSLDVLGARFGAYPHAALRIAEVPAWCDFGALATTGAIFFPEDRGLLADARGGARGAGRGVDLVARRVAHEVAHQWWGHALDAAPVAGATTLHETLAKHAEQLVIAAMHGEGALAPMLAFDEDRYLARSAEERGLERTLLDATGQPYLYYGKGAVVMHALRDLLGAAAVDRALARLLSAHGGPGGAPTTLDLRDALRAESGSAADRALVDEWLGGRTVYDLRADSAAAVAIGGGRWRVAARFRARKTERVEGGEAARSADGEALDVAVYDDRPEVGRVLWAGKARVGGGALALSIDVEARPAYVVVDPFVRRIDRDRGDNRARVAMPGGAR